MLIVAILIYGFIGWFIHGLLKGHEIYDEMDW